MREFGNLMGSLTAILFTIAFLNRPVKAINRRYGKEIAKTSFKGTFQSLMRFLVRNHKLFGALAGASALDSRGHEGFRLWVCCQWIPDAVTCNAAGDPRRLWLQEDEGEARRLAQDTQDYSLPCLPVHLQPCRVEAFLVSHLPAVTLGDAGVKGTNKVMEPGISSRVPVS